MECYAIVWAVKKFQRYLYGQEIYLETDNQPLFIFEVLSVERSTDKMGTGVAAVPSSDYCY